MTSQNIPEAGYLRQAQLVGHVLPIGASTLWRWVKDGKFPKPIKISERVTVWRAEDVRAWMAEHQQQVSA